MTYSASPSSLLTTYPVIQWVPAMHKDGWSPGIKTISIISWKKIYSSHTHLLGKDSCVNKSAVLEAATTGQCLEKNNVCQPTSTITQLFVIAPDLNSWEKSWIGWIWFIYNIHAIGGILAWISPIADPESKTWVLMVYLGGTKLKWANRNGETGKEEKTFLIKHIEEFLNHPF